MGSNMTIHASAPVSILDLGNWTDTPFAEHGAVLNIAVDYPVQVTVRSRKRPGVMVRTQVTQRALESGGGERSCPLEYDLLRAAARYFSVDGIEADLCYSLPPECGVSAHASAMVVLTAAVAAFAGKNYTPMQISGIAHRLHSEALGQPLGVHGHMAATMGGIALYRTTPHPRVFATPLTLTTELQRELERRLALVLTGRTPRGDFLVRLASACQPGDRQALKLLWRLRSIPAQAFESLTGGDFHRLTAIVAEGAILQERLCPSFRTPESWFLSLTASRQQGVTKTNCEGGSVTVLAPPEQIIVLTTLIREAGYTVLPIVMSPAGLRVWCDQTAQQPIPSCCQAA